MKNSFKNLTSVNHPKQTFKQILTLLAAVLLLTGCRKTEGVAKVRIHVDNFTVSQEELPQARSGIADCNTIKAVTLAFYTPDGTEQYKVTQVKSDASTYTTFGDFNLSLPMGSYTMVVLGYSTMEGSPFTLTSPTLASYTGEHALETFAATQAVNISSTEEVNLSATLSRIVSKLQVYSSDGRTANASKLRVTLSGGSKSFNPTTGLATDNNGFINTVNISAAEGSVSNSITFLFLNSDEQTVDVVLDVLNASGESISHKEVDNVPLKRNRATILTGSLYNASAGSDFTVNTEWLTSHNMSF
jgi:hypothetical protein